MNNSWNKKIIKQQPNWEDSDQLKAIINQLHGYPNLVSINEIRELRNHLSQVAQGKGFIIQGGDCAETFIDLVRIALKIN